MKWKVITVLSLIVALAAVAYIIYDRGQDRFYMITTSTGVVYEVDKCTGDTWELKGGSKVFVNDEKRAQQNKPIRLPPEVIGNLHATAKILDAEYSTDYLQVNIHNESDWVIEEIVAFVSTKDSFGRKWKRHYNLTGNISPFSSESLMVEVTNGKGLTIDSWLLVSGAGYQQKQVSGHLVEVDYDPFNSDTVDASKSNSNQAKPWDEFASVTNALE